MNFHCVTDLCDVFSHSPRLPIPGSEGLSALLLSLVYTHPPAVPHTHLVLWDIFRMSEGAHNTGTLVSSQVPSTF